MNLEGPAIAAGPFRVLNTCLYLGFHAFMAY